MAVAYFVIASAKCEAAPATDALRQDFGATTDPVKKWAARRPDAKP